MSTSINLNSDGNVSGMVDKKSWMHVTVTKEHDLAKTPHSRRPRPLSIIINQPEQLPHLPLNTIIYMPFQSHD